VVGLIESDYLDCVEIAGPLADQVVEAARSRDHNVGAAIKTANLPVIWHASVHGDHAQAHCLGERLNRLRDLPGKFARGDDDQGTWVVRFAGGTCEAPDDRQAESERLTRAGASPSQNVATADRIGDHCGLNWRGLGDAVDTENLDELLGYAKRAELRCSWIKSIDRRAARVVDSWAATGPVVGAAVSITVAPLIAPLTASARPSTLRTTF
jgi:hypothetical protein